MILTLTQTAVLPDVHLGQAPAVSPTDIELMERVALRDRDAFEELYDRHSTAALGLALKIMGERNSAEDLVQEAFWRVWKRSDTFQAQRGQFMPWLFGIVHNLAIDEMRRRHSRPEPLSIDADETMLDQPSLEPEVEETVFQALSGAKVREALAELPEIQRHAIELAYFNGLSHHEIAIHLDIPVGTIHTRIRLGLLKLHQALMPMTLEV